MKKLFYCLFVVAAFMTSCTQDQIEKQNLEGPISKTEINEKIFQTLNQTGEFRWNMVDDQTAWSALVQSDKILSIGYKPANVKDVHSIIHKIDIYDAEWTAARNELLAIINETLEEDPNFISKDHIYMKDVLPVIIVHTDNFELLSKLRANKDLIRYAEPMGYEVETDINNNPEVTLKDGSGCGDLNAATGINSNDYYNLPPYNNKVPWTYSKMNVDDAWAYSTGDNVTVAVFDTGTSNNQNKLRGGFNSGYSTGRYVSPRSTHYTTTGAFWWKKTTLDSPNDQCGHGTQMSGTVAAPRSEGNSIVGVAYNANLLSYRVTEDVIINGSSEKDAVSDAFVEIAQEGDAKIVSMSLGDVVSNGQVEDAIIYAYNNGIAIFAAAGTSLSWTSWYGVIFPANLNQTIAVTGVTDESNYERCEICHDGDKVDFVVKMERSSNRKGLTLLMSGNGVSWVGGSSTATAHTAGAAALVWSKFPSLSRTGVLNKLKASSENYPSRDNDFGYGTYDVLQAVQ